MKEDFSCLCLPFGFIYMYVYIYIYIYSVRKVSVATDEGPSPKLALSEGGSRGNIES